MGEHVITASEAAVRYLGRGNKSVYEVRQNLKKKEYSDDEIDAAVKLMTDCGYLDDEKYCRWFIRAQREKGRGLLRIREELRLKRGIDEEIISLVLSEDEKTDETESARIQAEKITAGREITPKIIEKVGRRLAYLGYEAGDISKIMRELRLKVSHDR